MFRGWRPSEQQKKVGGETATARFEEIVKLSPATSQYKGIIIAVIDTNSTSMLAPLDGMIVVGIDDIQPDGDNHILTFWEWESGIPTTTDAIAADQNATTATEVEEVEEEDE